MNPALFLLIRLKIQGFLRRWGRGLKSPKGILLSLVGMLVFAPWLYSIFLSTRYMPDTSAVVVRYGPIALLAYAIVTLFSSSGERLIYFTPAEVAFLFPGPFRHRQILGYKLISVVFATLFSSLFFSVAFSTYRKWWFAGFVGVFLTLIFFQYLAIVVSLVAATAGAMANTIRRRVVLGVLAALVLVPLISASQKLMESDPRTWMETIENSTIIQYASTPFRPFVNTFTASRLWPDLLTSASLSLLAVGLVTGAIFALNASYLEAIANSSAKTYERLQQMKRGASLTRASKKVSTGRQPIQLPDFGWLAGIGPTFWRQVLSAIRDPIRLVLVVVMVSLPAFLMLFSQSNRLDKGGSILLIEGAVVWVTVFLTPVIPFDFRGDVDRMESLKTLPIHPWAMAVGQILTPALILSVPQIIVLAIAAFRIGNADNLLLVTPFLVLPANFLIIAIDNLLFLLFPTRVLGGNPADVTAFGRQILLVFAKAIGILVTGGVATLAGMGFYYFLIRRVDLAALAALVASLGFVAGIVPLLGLAFERYDVASDTPA